jgi:hypothetical protein
MDTNQLDRLRHISPQELATLGMQGFAYIKRVLISDTVAYAIHTADGTQAALVPSYELAVATLRQNDLEPVSIH